MIVEAWLSRAALSSPGAIALECDGERLSYAALDAAAHQGAAQLAARGVSRGDAVAIALPPGIAFAQALHACWLLGARAVPLDVRITAEQRKELAAGCAANVEEPLAFDAGLDAGSDARASEDASSQRLRDSASNPVHDLDEVAVVLHTSGTTSKPKRVEITFGNLLWSALGSAAALGSKESDRWLCTLPVCHVGGLSILVRSAIYGSTAVVHERFDTQRALRAIMQEGITIVSVVATTLSRLLDAGLERPPALKVALAGGGPVPDALLRRAAAAGVPVSQTYGLTESCSQATTVPVAEISAPGGVVGEAAAVAVGEAAAVGAASLGAGRPLFCTRVQIAPDGEILLSGPTIAPKALALDGWLHTGDLGRLDEQGNLHVIGRKSDTIVSGGENVAPAEVEAALERHPDVREAAVLGRPHPEWGEAVTAIVLPRDGARIAAEELRAHCASMLAPFKVPKEFLFISDPLPRTRSGKLLRRELA